jgi:adenylate cyclase
MAARAPRIETREHRRASRIIAAGLLTLLLLAATTSDVWRAVDGRAFDLLSTLAAPARPADSPILVAIDEPSFSALERQWPWPRDIHARLMERLRAAGVRAIGMDVVFADPSDPAADAALAGAAGRDTVFAADETLHDDPHGASLIRTDPLPLLLSNGARSGVASVSLDGDGVLRRLPAYPDSFAAMIARAAGHAPARPDGDPRLLQYFGPPGSYPRISYYQALDPDHYLPPDLLRGRTVIVGYALQAAADVGAGATDAFETPWTAATGQLAAGVEAQATLVDNLVHGLSIGTWPRWLDALCLALGGLAAWGAARPPAPLRKAVGALALLLATFAASWLLLRFGRVWLSPAGPGAAIALVTAGLAARDYMLERRLRHDVQGAFAQYLAPAFIERLVRDPGQLRLGGETRELTILFADIRGFTTISETMKDDPEGLVSIINGILTPLSDAVVRHGGTIDKYIGDCVMAFWNAPLDDPDHAMNAVRAACDMLAAIDPINAGLGARTPPLSIRIGIGINSGRCVVGNMGSDQRFDYSVLGDAVNIASRLESASKDYGVPLLIGQSTAAAVGDRAPLALLDHISVRGRTEAQAVCTLASLAPDAAHWTPPV